jgi:hypothetical protein
MLCPDANPGRRGGNEGRLRFKRCIHSTNICLSFNIGKHLIRTAAEDKLKQWITFHLDELLTHETCVELSMHLASDMTSFTVALRNLFVSVYNLLYNYFKYLRYVFL